MGGIGRGRTRIDADPYNYGTKTPLRLLSQWCVGEEAGRVNGRPVDPLSPEQVTSLTVPQIPLSGVLKTPRSDLTGMEACLPTGLGKGVVRKSERYTSIGWSPSPVMPL